jgi:hypothetical protein
VNGLDLVFYRKLRERLNEEKLTRAEFICQGSYATLEEYKASVGYIKALSDTLIWAQEINDKLIGDKN